MLLTGSDDFKERQEIDLVIVAAFRAELPVAWLADAGWRVFSLHELEMNEQIPLTVINRSVLILTTGVGHGAAHRAGLWIKRHLNPAFVLNIGGAASVRREFAVGQWLQAVKVASPDGGEYPLDKRLPFSWPKEVDLANNINLISVRKPVFGELPQNWLRADLIDMEALALAEALADAPHITLHVLKMVTDYSGPDAKNEFKAALSKMRSDLRTILGFLQTPETADISVVIPVHNRPKPVAAAIDSVLQQSLAPREIIVVDDGSTDTTNDILQGYGKKITLLTKKETGGVSAARNLGISASQGSWIALLDSDDLWTKRRLEKQWSYARRHPIYAIMQCEEIWLRSGVRVNACKHHKKQRGWIWRDSLYRCLISPSAVLMQKRLWEHYGGFNPALAACEDYDLWLKITRNHPVGLSGDASLIKTGGHSDQLSRRFPAMDKFRVTALIEALDGESDGAFAVHIKAALHKKLGILLAGARKRGKASEENFYQKTMDDLQI